MTLMVAESGRDYVDEHEPDRRRPSAELAMGLQLLRASSLTTVRLQLALARRDRRVAMAALDTLAAVDAEIEDLVDRVGPAAPTPELEAIAAWLAQEKEAVTADKLNLACDISGPGLVSPPDRLSQVAEADPPALADREVAEAVPDLDGVTADADEPAPERRWWLFVMSAVVIAVLAAGVVMAFMLPRGEPLPAMAEVSRLIGLR